MKKNKAIKDRISFTERGGIGFLRALINLPEPRISELELLITIMKEPLTKAILVLMGNRFKLTNKQRADIACVSVKTYQQWKPSKKLSPPAAEHLLKIIEVHNSGMQTFDSNERSFVTWMKTSIPALGKKMPVDLMISSKEKAELVNSELIRMEYGILS